MDILVPLNCETSSLVKVMESVLFLLSFLNVLKGSHYMSGSAHLVIAVLNNMGYKISHIPLF